MKVSNRAHSSQSLGNHVMNNLITPLQVDFAGRLVTEGHKVELSRAVNGNGRKVRYS